jgi:hypothetical protein
MMYFYYLLFIIGLVFYVLALVRADCRASYVDVGNALMLITAVLLLIRVAWKVSKGTEAK